MTAGKFVSNLSDTGKRIALGAVIALLVASCASVAPILTSAAIKFGQDVLAVASHNVSPRYASEVEQLLLALLEESTGLHVPPGQGQVDYGDDSAGSYGYGDDGQESYGYGDDNQGSYGYGDESEESSTYSGDYGDSYEYGEDSAAADSGGYGYGEPQAQYDNAPTSMEVGLFAQRFRPDGQVILQAVNDGDVLYDGRGSPEAGDKIKVTFKANCSCYVYIVGIDATGFVAQIFPDPDSTIANPVTAGRQYTLPEGDMWWGLDDYRGVETVYFFASHTRRIDIEEHVASLAGTERRLPTNYQTVQTAAVIPQTRGMVKVQSAQPTAMITDGGETQTVTPTAFTAAISGVDLVITRWFEHR